MSKAPKQRKAQLHYQPYQSSGGATTTAEDNFSGLLAGGITNSNASNAQSQGSSAALDYGLSDLMDPVLAGYSSNLSRNLWDDWNESDTNMVKFDMLTDESMGAATTVAASATASSSNATATTTNSTSNGFMTNMMMSHPSQLDHIQHQPHLQQQNHQLQSLQQQQQPSQLQLQPQQQQQATDTNMDLDGRNAPTANGFHSLSSQPRMSVKRSFSEDLASMLDEDDGHDQDQNQDPFGSANGGFHNQLHQQRGGFSFSVQQFGANSNSNNNSHASPLAHKPQLQGQQQSQQAQQGQQLLVQHATEWLNGFPAVPVPSQQQQQLQQQQQQLQLQQQREPPPPLSPKSAARLEAHNQRPEPSPMERASAAIASTLVAIPNPCKDGEPPTTSSSTPTPTPSTPAAVTPSPFSAYSFMSAAIESAAKSSAAAAAAGEGSSEGAAANPFASAAAAAGMMMPGFMMYSMPMMGNYQAAAAAAAAMGMMPMGAMQMGPMGMPMGGMGMNPMGMPMGALGSMGMGGMQMPMGMPMMPMGMPTTPSTMPLTGDATTTGDAATKTAPKALQPKGGAVLAPAGGASGANTNASFVSIARKPEEPEVSTILKSLMEEEAKKKEKKLERNRDSARESRKKQQTYVESLENGIKRLQINRDLVVSYRWGVTGSGGPATHEWTERVGIITGKSEVFSTLQNPTNFQNLMRINRQRRALSLSRQDKERAIVKCFVGIGKQLAELRRRILELQVFRNLSNPASAVSQELSKTLQLSPEQQLQLQCHSNRVFDQHVLEMVKLFKVFFALRTQALTLNLMAPELERFFREVCAMEQLQKLLQWTELHRVTIEGEHEGSGLSLVS